MPGGDGIPADFHPFVKRIFKHAVPEGYVVAQPVAPKWTAEQKIVWPTEINKVDGMKFSTEKFVEAVIADVAAKHKLDPQRIYTLSWSLERAAGVCDLAHEPQSRRIVRRHVGVQSEIPAAAGCRQGARVLSVPFAGRPGLPLSDGQRRGEDTSGKGCKVQLTDYAGGHGWRGGLYEQIRGGINWLEKNAATR